MNLETLKVGSLIDCEIEHRFSSKIISNPNQRQAFVGCHVILLLQQMYKFKMGFILRQTELESYQSFHSKPFERIIWFFICVLMGLSAILFHTIHVWERRVLKSGKYWKKRCHIKDECSLIYQLLITISSCCQTSIPSHPRLLSRRAAYISYFLFSYVMYVFYTSNLLSHLVNGGEGDMSLRGLADSDYECVVLESMRNVLDGEFGRHVDYLKKKKLQNIRYVNITYGLQAVRAGQTALLSDYLTIYPKLKRTFAEHEICELVEVDIFTNIRKYLWTSKNYQHREQLRVGSFRLLESGLLRRLAKSPAPSAPERCSVGPISARFTHVLGPLLTLLSTCITSILILLIEIIYSKLRRLPYAE